MARIDEVKQALLEAARDNAEFREQLLNNPRETVQQALEVDLPDDVDVEIHEETADTFHLVLPPETSSELSAEELENVAGGKGALPDTETCTEVCSP